MCLLVAFVQAQITLRRNGLTDVEPDDFEFSFAQGGREWPGMCTTGRLQSPIAISDSYSNLRIVTAANSTIREFRVITPLIDRSELLIQEVHGIIVYWLMSTSLEQEILGSTIRQTMLEAHVNVPSEHTFNGLRFPLELHLVYSLSQPDGSIVTGLNIMIMFREGRANPFLDDLINPNHTTIDVSSVYPANGVIDDYYYYIGSVELPWPSCWEPFAWYMPNYVIEASPEQIQYFSDPVVANFSYSNGRGSARAVQPLNDRPVYHYITPRDSFLS